MFKKKFKIGSHNLLSSKDKKQLKKSLLNLFEPTCIEELFALKTQFNLIKV